MHNANAITVNIAAGTNAPTKAKITEIAGDVNLLSNPMLLLILKNNASEKTNLNSKLKYMNI